MRVSPFYYSPQELERWYLEAHKRPKDWRYIRDCVALVLMFLTSFAITVSFFVLVIRGVLAWWRGAAWW